MSTTATLDPREVSLPSSTFGERLKGDVGYQAFLLLRIAFTVAPIVFGLDKFFNVHGRLGGLSGALDQRHRPRQRLDRDASGRRDRDRGRHRRRAQAPLRRLHRRGMAGGIIIDLLTYSGYYDIALRDFGLMLGALTLARLASKYDPPGLEVRL